MSQIDWDEYFLDIATQVAKKSKDSTKVGCVIVDRKRRPVSFGYNGLIQGADESLMTLTERPAKYKFVIHAEMNAILFAHRELSGCTIYSEFAPCENCLKHCLQMGIVRFVYRQVRVRSYLTDKQRSMTNIDTDEAIIRMLAAVSNVETLNLTNGKNYVEEIMECYEKNSEDWKRLKQWNDKAESKKKET